MGMKLQFSSSAILIAVAFVGIWLGALLAMPRALGLFRVPTVPFRLDLELVGAAMYAPVWLPLCLVGFALGQGRSSAWILVAVVIAEALALLATGIAFWCFVALR
jgi:hypothetical protein